jgi:hypothetical protein
MATFVGDSSSERYTSIAISKSSSSSSAITATSLANADRSHLEGLDGIEIHLFTSITKMQKIIKSQCDKLQAGESNQQFLVLTVLPKIHLMRSTMHARIAVFKNVHG